MFTLSQLLNTHTALSLCRCVGVSKGCPRGVRGMSKGCPRGVLWMFMFMLACGCQQQTPQETVPAHLPATDASVCSVLPVCTVEQTAAVKPIGIIRSSFANCKYCCMSDWYGPSKLIRINIYVKQQQQQQQPVLWTQSPPQPPRGVLAGAAKCTACIIGHARVIQWGLKVGRPFQPQLKSANCQKDSRTTGQVAARRSRKPIRLWLKGAGWMQTLNYAQFVYDTAVRIYIHIYCIWQIAKAWERNKA